MIVDSSVWVDFLGRRPSVVARSVRDYLASGGRVYLTATVVQEVLQGARDMRQLDALVHALAAFPICGSSDVRETARLAGALYARCRWQGITIGSPNDCLIAAVAIESGHPVLSKDRDFVHIRKLDSRLQLVDAPPES
jgi:predicted nucleic acid-binding protein